MWKHIFLINNRKMTHIKMCNTFLFAWYFTRQLRTATKTDTFVLVFVRSSSTLCRALIRAAPFFFRLLQNKLTYEPRDIQIFTKYDFSFPDCPEYFMKVSRQKTSKRDRQTLVSDVEVSVCSQWILAAIKMCLYTEAQYLYKNMDYLFIYLEMLHKLTYIPIQAPISTTHILCMV